MRGHEAVIKLLPETGKVDANSKDKPDGRTLLWWAAKGGHEAFSCCLEQARSMQTSRCSPDLSFFPSVLSDRKIFHPSLGEKPNSIAEAPTVAFRLIAPIGASISSQLVMTSSIL